MKEKQIERVIIFICSSNRTLACHYHILFCLFCPVYLTRREQSEAQSAGRENERGGIEERREVECHREKSLNYDNGVDIMRSNEAIKGWRPFDAISRIYVRVCVSARANYECTLVLSPMTLDSGREHERERDSDLEIAAKHTHTYTYV